MGLWSEVDRVQNKADEQATEKRRFYFPGKKLLSPYKF